MDDEIQSSGICKHWIPFAWEQALNQDHDSEQWLDLHRHLESQQGKSQIARRLERLCQLIYKQRRIMVDDEGMIGRKVVMNRILVEKEWAYQRPFVKEQDDESKTHEYETQIAQETCIKGVRCHKAEDENQNAALTVAHQLSCSSMAQERLWPS
jgi:hypothetical protein